MKSHESENKINKHLLLTDEPDKTDFPIKHPDTSFTKKNIATRTREQQENIQTAIENEKSKLGQELHDGVNPLLSAALLYLKILRPASKQGRKIKETIQTILLEAIGCIRNLASDLVISEQKQYNLNDLLEGYSERLKSIVEFSIAIDIDDSGTLNRLTDHEKTNLYRIIQEQINNIIKYSKARNVKIQFKKEPTGLCLSIQDDGIGFDTNLPKNGIGLLNMKKRMEDLHGTIDIESSPGNGCNIYIRLPLHEENSPGSFYSY